MPSSSTSAEELRLPLAVKLVLDCPPGFKFDGVTPGESATSASGERPARGSDRINLFSTTWPSVALVVLSSVAELSTLTVVAMAPTASSTAMVACCWTCNSKAARQYSLKPADSNASRYPPAGIPLTQ